MTRPLFAVLAAVLAVSACSQVADKAAPGVDRGDRRSARQDANGDGKVTLDEVKAGQTRLLERADANRDGKIDLKELEGLPERMADRLDRVDANQDREITRAELEAAAESRFRRRDSNGDGVLTGDEMRTGRRGEGPRDGKGQPVS